MSRDNRPQKILSHHISGLTRVLHSIGLSLNTAAKLVQKDPKITPPGALHPLYGCAAGQISQATYIPTKAPTSYCGIHKVVCDVIEKLTTIDPKNPPAHVRLDRAVGEYTGPYRATKENWPMMFDDGVRWAGSVPERISLPGTGLSIPTPGAPPKHELRSILKTMGLSYGDLEGLLAKRPEIATLTSLGVKLGIKAAQVSGAAFIAGKDPGNYQSIQEVVAKAIESITGGRYAATRANWPRMTTDLRKRKT